MKFHNLSFFFLLRRITLLNLWPTFPLSSLSPISSSCFRFAFIRDENRRLCLKQKLRHLSSSQTKMSGFYHRRRLLVFVSNEDFRIRLRLRWWSPSPTKDGRRQPTKGAEEGKVGWQLGRNRCLRRKNLWENSHFSNFEENFGDEMVSFQIKGGIVING